MDGNPITDPDVDDWVSYSPLGSYQSYRVRCSARTSGAITIVLVASAEPAGQAGSDGVPSYLTGARQTIPVGPVGGSSAQGGAGAVTATTQRVAIATDANAVTVSGTVTVDEPVTVDGTVAVTGVSTAANQTTELASLAAIESDMDALRISAQLIDDTINTLGTATYTEASTRGALIAAVRRDADTSPVNTDNEMAPLTLDANGRLKVEAFSGETLPISGTVTVNEPVSVDDNAGSLTVDAPVGTPVNVQVGNATLSAGVIDETGSSAVDALAVGGATPNDSVDSGNPLKIGGLATGGTGPTAVASGDRVSGWFGAPVTRSSAPTPARSQPVAMGRTSRLG